MQPGAVVNLDSYGLTRVVVVLELIIDLIDQCVDPRHGLELDSAEDRSLESLREGLLDLGSTGQL